MAAAGGHWGKAMGGPYAGKAVFVPAKKSYPPAAGIGGADLPPPIPYENAYSQGQLIAYQTVNGQWLVITKPPDAMPLFASVEKDKALAKMDNMNKIGIGKALASDDMGKVGEIINNSNPAPKPAAPAAKPAAKPAAPAAKPAADVTGFKDVRDVYGDIYQANDALAGHFDLSKVKTTEAQIDAVSHYQDGKYDYINRMLWKGESGYYSDATVKGWIKDIDGAMKASPGLPHDMMLFRFKQSGSALHKWAEKAKIGTTYKSKGFDSTTVDSKFDTSPKVTMRYHAPKGTKGFYMNANGYSSSHPQEYEYLLPRNLKWEVTGKHVGSSGQITIDLELVSGG